MRLDEVHLGKGVWRSAEGDALASDLEAWTDVLPEGTVFTGLTAATVHGLWLPELPTNLPLVAAIPRRQGEVVPRHGGVQALRNATVPNWVWRGRARVATVPETLLSCGRFLGLLDLVVLIDSALAADLCDVSALWGISKRQQRGVVRFREALVHADGRSESPWESRLRLLHTSCGIPVTPQVELHDAHGRFVARADLVVGPTGQLQEYDGAVHREAEVHRRDLARERRIADARLVRRGWTARDLLITPEEVVAPVAEAWGRRISVGPWKTLVWHSLHRPGGRRELCRSLRPGLIWPDAQTSPDAQKSVGF